MAAARAEGVLPEAAERLAITHQTKKLIFVFVMVLLVALLTLYLQGVLR